MNTEQSGHNNSKPPTVRPGGPGEVGVGAGKTPTARPGEASETARPDAQTSGQASSADSTANGDRIGAWPIIRPLSHGGQAHIYIIDYQGKEAVLKLYDQEPKEKIFGQLKEISKSAGDLVVDVLETGHFTEPGKWYDNRWFEIQEYMQEGSMDNLIKTGSSLNESEFDSLVSQLTEALIFLHNKNIIHRDLKPANILLRSRQPLKIALTDFGISSLLADNASEKLTKAWPTPPFMHRQRHFSRLTERKSWLEKLGIGGLWGLLCLRY